MNRNKMWAVVKKELYRFFTDKKLVFSSVIVPGLMIYVLYSFMGTGMQSVFNPSDDYKPQVVVYNMPASQEKSFKIAYMELLDENEYTLEEYNKKVEEKEIDLVVVFPEDFDEVIASRNEVSTYKLPNVAMYYNSSRSESSMVSSVVQNMLTVYEDSIANAFTVNEGEGQDLASEKDQTGQIFSMLLPMLLLMFIYSGCMGVATESIAGEKERGTIATLLVTPLRRSDLALGKIISLSIISLLSGLSSFVGTMLSLPKLMGTGLELNVSYYTMQDYVILLLVIFSSVLLIVGLISVISSYTNSVKQAATAVTPLMVIVMMIGVSSMAITKSMSSIFYAIPLFNNVLIMNGVFSFNYSLVHVAITLVSNIVVTVILVFVLTKLFNSEKVMFSK